MKRETTLSAANQAKKASYILPSLSSETRNGALEIIAQKLLSEKGRIFSANTQDVTQAQENHLEPPLVKRLLFQEEKLQEVVAGLRALIHLPDPLGTVLDATELDQGLTLYKVSCPLGVIAMIFESRPDALVQMAALSLKSGNSVLLKGGTEARETNKILASVIQEASREAGIPDGWIQLLESRQQVTELLELHQTVDLIIPRGSNAFVQHIMKNTLIPVMGHADGICNMYVDEHADVDLGVQVALDSKTQYVAVCNALENLLVHQSVANEFLPKLHKALNEKNTQIRGCQRTCAIIPVTPARDEDWSTEYLDYILSVKIVDSLDEALDFINTYGSGHTDSIVTADKNNAQTFFTRVDTASVMWNCSTRFADGFRYGLGAEVGVSTGKLHARGPVGLEGLVTYKWQLLGDGHTVQAYSGTSPERTYTHNKVPGNTYPFLSKT